jgi:acetyl-CoA acetyltransferase
MPSDLYKAAAIVGAAESDEIGYMSEPKSNMRLHIEAIHNVSEQTGIPISQIDGVFAPGVASQIAEYLGIHPKYIDTTSVGGCSFEMHLHHALAAIHAGIIDVALVSHGQMGWSVRHTGGRGGGGGRPAADPWSGEAQFYNPYGFSGAPSNYSHAMNRHNYRYGTTPEDFAHIAVGTREWAMLNPRAVMYSAETNPAGGPITVEDVANSRLISWPLTLLHVCLVTDYGGAILITNPDIARSLPTKPVWIAGAGESQGHSNMLEMEDFTATSAAASAATAYKMAGMGSDDMEMAMIYDSFTVTAGITAEMLGLAPRGEGHLLWKDGHANPGGRLPINTNGGGLSFNHSGMYGMQLLVEAYRQLSGTAEDGIHGDPGKQTNAQSCIVNGTGGSLSVTGTVVLIAD